jgi:hypothetical protein
MRRARWLAAAAAGTGLAGAAAAVAIGIGDTGAQQPRPSAAFAWLHPAPAPRGWTTARLPGGTARLSYPPGWHAIQTDAGTASAGLRAPGQGLIGYLNATPRQGDETLANWSRFRPAHVAGEGARQVQPIASATGLAFRSGRGSCVIDSYRTSLTRYREIACLVAGAHASTVVVGAAPSSVWATQAQTIERGIASFQP